LDRIGNAIEEVNLDYAVIERIDPIGLRVSVLPFSIANVLADPNSADNLKLEAGDIITVFSDRDLQIPQGKRRVFVRIEGEVNRPGVYQVLPGERLTNILQKAGGTTPDSYLFGMGIYRESVKQNQLENLEKLVRRVEQESSGAVAVASQSVGASSDPGSFQARSAALQRSWRGWAWCGKTPRAAPICHGFAARHCSRAASLRRPEAVWRTTPIWHADCPLSLSLVSSLKTRRFCKHTPAPGAFHGHTPPKPQAFMP
jgi:hypothetical protein